MNFRKALFSNVCTTVEEIIWKSSIQQISVVKILVDFLSFLTLGVLTNFTTHSDIFYIGNNICSWERDLKFTRAKQREPF